MNKKDKILHQISKLPYATIYNFQPWTYKNKEATLKSSLQWPYKIIRSLYKEKIIREIPIYPFRSIKRSSIPETFYTIHANPVISNGVSYRGRMSVMLTGHESGLMDILLAFLNLYSNSVISINTTPSFELKDGYLYKPDAHIRITTSNNNVYDFLIEFERSASNSAISSKKIAKIDKMKKFSEYGLSRFTKFLFVFTIETYDVFLRPIQYTDIEVAKQQSLIDKRLFTLLEGLHKTVNQHLFRFMSFHDFYRLNDSVWYDPAKKRVKLIDE